MFNLKKKDNNDNSITKRGLIMTLQNEILRKEFMEFAAKKKSMHYATFHIEYLEFKELFKTNKQFLEEISTNSITVPGPNPTNQKDKKLIEIFIKIYAKADELFSKYFNKKSNSNINLPSKLVKNVSTNLNEYNTNYNRYLINGSKGQTLEYKSINCENIFDEVHEEVINHLFSNVYKYFVKEKSKSTGLGSSVKPVWIQLVEQPYNINK
eukprot:jgi/Orpsp1_1/1174715/evm.model.c7180000051086.1